MYSWEMGASEAAAAGGSSSFRLLDAHHLVPEVRIGGYNQSTHEVQPGACWELMFGRVLGRESYQGSGADFVPVYCS